MVSDLVKCPHCWKFERKTGAKFYTCTSCKNRFGVTGIGYSYKLTKKEDAKIWGAK
jgi:hypothetical protein